MASIRDYAITIYTAVTASMVCEMPVHASGDLLVAFVNKDTASAFTTPSGWTAQQTQTSAGAAGGVYTKRATSSSETVTFALTSETCCAVIVAVKDCNGTTEADAISGSAKSGADDSSLPLTGVGITPGHNNCLILHGLSTDSGIAPCAYAPWVNLFAGDTGANSLCVSYTQQKTAAAITAPNHWTGAAADDSRGFIIAIRDVGTTPTTFDPYIPLSNVSSSRLCTMSNVPTVDETAGWRSAAGIVITSVNGKTVSGVLPQTTSDAGINPFRPAITTGGVSSTTNLGHSECPFSSSKDFTAKQGLIFGTYQNTTPRDFIDTGRATQGGKYILLASATPASNHRAWVVGGQFTATESPGDRNNYLIEVANTDTVYVNTGTPNMAAVTDIAIGSSGYYGAPSARWCELHLLDVTKMAGGSADNPFGFDELIETVNNGNSILPLIKQTGASAQLWLPLQFGGIDPIHCNFNLNTFQYPRRADEVTYVDFHVSNNKVGIEFYGLADDNITFTNCVFTSPSPYYWRFNSSHSASANIDFSGTSVVGATVTLRSTVLLDSVRFIDCGTLTQNTADLTNCTFDNSKITANDPSNIVDCAFISAGTGHAIEITTAGTYTFTGNTFTGYGADATTDASIYNNSGGAVTLNIAGGGDTPTVRNGAGASTTVNNNRTITLTGLKNPSEVRVFLAGTQTEVSGTGAENVTTGSHAFSVTLGLDIDIVILALGYQNQRILNYSADADASIPVSQVLDRQYENL